MYLLFDFIITHVIACVNRKCKCFYTCNKGVESLKELKIEDNISDISRTRNQKWEESRGDAIGFFQKFHLLGILFELIGKCECIKTLGITRVAEATSHVDVSTIT
jgi:hypothetical protein